LLMMPAVLLHSAPRDSADVSWRSFDEKAIGEFRRDRSFAYEKERTEATSLIGEFLNWLEQIFRFDDLERTDSDIGSSAVSIIYLILAAAAIAFIVWGLTRAQFLGFITGKSKTIVPEHEVTEEDIHAIEYETELQKAEREKDYRRAIRLQYLEVLKELTDRGWIDWKPNKTNREYDNELRDTPWRKKFQNLTLIFEYVWYGEFEIGESTYVAFAHDYRRFLEAVRSGAFNSKSFNPASA